MPSNPNYPGSQFPAAVDQLSNLPDRELPDAVMSIEASLLGVPGAPALPPAPPPSTLAISGALSGNPVSSGGNMSAIGSMTAASYILSSAGGALRGGSGVPGAGLGNNGDYWFRTDAPGTANQRIYVKSAGAWVGIV